VSAREDFTSIIVDLFWWLPSVEFPADAMTTLEKAPNVMTVEREGEAKTQ
jgi:hypothetical protein